MWSIVIYFVATGILVASAQSSENCHIRPAKRLHSCCPLAPKYITPDLINKCNLPPPAPSGRVRGLIYPKGTMCDTIHCMFAHYNLTTHDDKINVTKFTKFMKRQHTKEWKTIIDTTVQTCSDLLQKTNNCPEMRFMFCFKNNMIKHCPATSVWLPDEECQELKTYIGKCPMRRDKNSHKKQSTSPA